jgi:hypothetical protein
MPRIINPFVGALLAFYIVSVVSGCGGESLKGNPSKEIQASRDPSSSGKEPNVSTSGRQSTVQRTQLIIKNETAADAQVFVVLAAAGGACAANDYPPITAAQLAASNFCENVVENPQYSPFAGKCQLILKAGESKAFPDIPNTCISGNVTFGGYPSCPNTAFPTGFSTAEFTLNPPFGNKEDVDISLVNGFNSLVTVSMEGGNGWVVSNTDQPISKITPKLPGQNAGNPGVYPEDCTDCIRLQGSPVCPGFSPNPKCQPSRICDAQRDVTANGGQVTIALQGT